MKFIPSLLALVAASAVSTSAFATHRYQCDVEAEITNTSRLARLDDSAIFASPNGPVKDDVEVVAAIKITAVNADCRALKKGESLMLHVKKELQEKYTVSNKLKLTYQNMGDVNASKISWTVR